MIHKRFRFLLTLFLLLSGMCCASQPQAAYAQSAAVDSTLTALPEMTDSVLSPTTATFPFFDDFEASALDPDWASNSSGVGRVEISTDTPYNGAHSVFIGQKLIGNGSASLTLSIDLSSQADVYLDFWWRATGEAWDPANGVYISENDGAIWKKIGNLNGNPQVYSHAVINLSNAASANGLIFNNHFMIRIFYDTYGERIGGLRIDDLRIGSRSGVVATFPLQENFEAPTMQQGLYPQSWGVGRTEISTETPHDGIQHIFMGQAVGGNGGAHLDLIVDLLNQTDVYLDFWWRATGAAWDPTNGVYISDDNGTNWKKIGDLNGNPQVYSHAIINLSHATSANGLTFNNHFMIRLLYDTYGERIGGLRIDDLRVNSRTEVVGALPLQETFETQTVQQGLYPQSWGVGRAEISDENPQNGNQHIFIGQEVGGNGGAHLDLLTDLSNQTDVYLDFWWRATGAAWDPANGVYISDDNGTNWKRIGDLNGNPQVYSHAIINLSNAASANGLTLNNHFMIRIFYDTYGEQIGGLRIDDLRIGTQDPRLIDRFFVYLPLVRK